MREAHDDVRQRIVAALKQRQGLHKSDLMRIVGKGWGAIGHHIKILTGDGVVVTETHGRRLWIFLHSTTRAERDWVVVRSHEKRRRIADFFGLGRRATIDALSRELDMSKKEIRTHLLHLENAGEVESTGKRPRHYALASLQRDR